MPTSVASRRPCESTISVRDQVCASGSASVTLISGAAFNASRTSWPPIRPNASSTPHSTRRARPRSRASASSATQAGGGTGAAGRKAAACAVIGGHASSFSRGFGGGGFVRRVDARVLGAGDRGEADQARQRLEALGGGGERACARGGGCRA